MTSELTKAAQQAIAAIDALLRNTRRNAYQLSDKVMGDAENASAELRRALTQRPAAQSEAQALAHNMMLWREDAVHNGNEYVPVHVRTLEKVIAQLRDMPAHQQATPEPVGQAPSVWNSLQIASWIGSQLMREPSMFERNVVCKFVRSLGRHPTLLKHSPKDTRHAPAVPEGFALVPVEPEREMMEAMPSLPAIGAPGDMELKAKGWSLKAIQNRHRWLAALAAAQVKGGEQ